ncbi:hypothetical protein FKM82_011830 [Ascaphus truei]
MLRPWCHSYGHATPLVPFLWGIPSPWCHSYGACHALGAIPMGHATPLVPCLVNEYITWLLVPSSQKSNCSCFQTRDIKKSPAAQKQISRRSQRRRSIRYMSAE